MALPFRSPRGLTGRSVLVITTAMALVIATAGAMTYRDYEREVRVRIDNELTAIADLKAGELVQWRREREADARFFAESRTFTELAARFLRDGDAAAGAEIQQWFLKMRAGDRYERLSLLDAAGVPRLSDPSGDAAGAPGTHGGTVAEAHAARTVRWVDFHRNSPADDVHLSLLSPLTDPQGSAVGTVELRIDPSVYLYPFIQRWPVPSDTAETILVRRDGDDVVYLSPMRRSSLGPLELRLPLSRTDVPSVRGALGEEGVFEGVDYLGRPVVAAVKDVPDAPWVIAARVDPAEAWAPVRSRLQSTIAIGLLLLVATGAGLTTAWQRSRALSDEALADSERRYRELFESNPHPMWVYDRETLRFLAVNDAAVTYYGWTREQFLAMTIADIRPADDLPRLRAVLASRGESVRRSDGWRHLKADGTLIDVEIHSHRLEFLGRPAVLVLANDVTARLRAEREVRDLNDALRRQHAANATALARLEALVEASPTILYTLSANVPGFPATWVSENITRILGYTPQQALAPGWWAANLHPDDLPGAREENESLMARGEIVHEYRFRDTRGRYRIIRDELRLTGAHEIVGAWTDITAQREAEAQQRLQLSALEAAANAIVVAATDGRIEWANPAFTDLTGYTLAEAVGRTPGDLLRSGRHDRAFYEAMWRTVLEGRVWQGELVNRRKDGTLYDEEMTITPVRDAGGRIAHFVAIKQSITERKHLQAQLLQAQRMESVGRLAGGVAHDFNNLLTVINSYAELSIEGLRDDDPLRAALVEIHTAGERAAGLTRQLLAFSRKQVLQPKDIDLNGIVANMEKMLRRLIGEDIQFALSLAPQACLVRADPGQLEQVLMNLAVNARDAMPRGGTLTLGTRRVELDAAAAGRHAGLVPGRWVELVVADTGVGMTPDTLERAFEPFFTTKAQGEGTGLGLPTVYGIVQQSGGAIWVTSAPGRGTTFTIALPELAEASPDAHAGAVAAPGGREAVLIVEDDDMLRDLTRLVLTSAGYEALTAADGENALLLLEQRDAPVALLLTDVVMPGMTGRELAERVRARWPSTKVLYMSGYTDDAIVRHGVLDGRTAFLNKPFSRGEVLTAVRKALDGE